MKKRNFFIIVLVSMLVTGVSQVNYAMPKITPDQVVNGASKPKSGVAGAANRTAKLAGSGVRVATGAAKGAAKEATKEAAKGAVTGGIGGAVTGGSAGAVGGAIGGAAGGVALGGAIGVYKGYKSGVESAKYPKK